MTRKTTKTTELLDELLADCASPEEILGKNGLLKQLTKGLVERALEGELNAHLGEEWYTGGSDTPKLLKFSIPKDKLKKLKIAKLDSNSDEYDRLTDLWIDQKPVPGDLQYLIDDYDAIYAPMETDGRKVYGQLKFNPRSKNFLNNYKPETVDIKVKT